MAEMDSQTTENWLDAVNFNADGLIPAIVQNEEDQRILMMAWMNREALNETVTSGKAVYWSRSRNKLWRKGEESGFGQTVKQVRLDCDADVIVLAVSQTGGIACHTGRESCFYRILEDGKWTIVDPVLKDPGEIYGDQ